MAACARAGIEPGDVRSVCCGRTGAECKLPLDLLSSVPPGCSQRAPKPLRARSVTGRLMRPSRSRTSAASSAGRGSRRAPLATSKYPSRSRVPRTAPTTQCRYTYRRQIRPLHTYARPFAQQFPRLTSAPTSAAPQRGGGVGAQLLPLPTASSGRAQHSEHRDSGRAASSACEQFRSRKNDSSHESSAGIVHFILPTPTIQHAWCAGRAPCGRTRALAEVGRSQSPRVRHARALLKRHSGGAAHPTDDGAPSSVGCARTVQSSRR